MSRSGSNRDLSNRARGAWGESQAARHFRSLGFDIIATGWRAPEPELRGDLDVIARQGELVVVCEVKARRSDGHGGAAAAVTPAKQAHVRRLAESWLRQAENEHPGERFELRFDVVAIEGVRLTHFPDAF